MVEMGYESYGNELMFNGYTGEMFNAPIFIGPTFYMRLKQMVEDKINYRDTGARQRMTHQPPEGRGNDGGLRIGEMERDVLLAHGISAFAQESMMKRSDGETVVYQPETGLLTADTKNVQGELEMPYTMRLFAQEIQSMHVSVKLVTDHAT
jgi:DNA-directed RNA polymerase II subunit RPB2